MFILYIKVKECWQYILRVLIVYGATEFQRMW